MKNIQILIFVLPILLISCQKREAINMEAEVTWQNVYKLAQKYDCIAEATKNFKPSFDKGVVSNNDLTYYETWFSNTKQVKDRDKAQNEFQAKIVHVKKYEDMFAIEDEFYSKMGGSTPFTRQMDTNLRQKMLDDQFNIYYQRRDSSLVILP